MEMNLRRDFVFYTIVTFVSSCACWGMLIALNLPSKSTRYSTTLYLLGGFATAIVALLLPLFRDHQEKREYYRRFFRFQTPLSLYLLSVTIPLAMSGVSCSLVYFFGRNAISISAFVLGVMGLSFVLTAIYMKTESAIPCIILHTMINALSGLGLTYANDQTLAVWIDGIARIVIGVAAFIVVVKYPSRAREAV